MAQFLETIIRINAEMGNGFSKVGATLTELGSIVDGLSMELIDFGKESVEVYRDYEKSMRDAEVALSTNYGQGTQQLQRVMSQLDEAATEWAATTIFHTDDVSHAISEAAHAGWDYEQIMAGIPAAIKLAQAGSLDLSEAVDYVVKSTNAAGIGFEDMDYWIDLWTYAANSSASDIGEFGDAMLRMGSTMRFAANPEELMTLIAVTADMGSTGSEAGTMIRNSLMRLIVPTEKAKGVLEELGATSDEITEVMNDEALAAANATLASRGFTVFDQNGELRPILDIYSDLSDVLADIAGGYDKIGDNEEAMELLGAIFPTRTITEALNLLNAASDGYGGLYDSMMEGNAAGYGEYAAETMMDTLNGSIEIFLSKVERLKQTFGGELKDDVESFTGFFGDLVDRIAELEPDKFAALTGAGETLALAGPGLLTAGTAFRLIGLVFGTKGGAIAAGAMALATALGALVAWDEEKFDEKFGTMNLDLAELDRQLGNLTTDGEQRLSVMAEYTTRLGELGEEYQTAVGAFSQEITMATLTGKELTPTERKQIVEYGKSMTDALVEGINTRRESDLVFLNTITPDAEDMTAEETETYNSLYYMLDDYYGELKGKASQTGAQIQQAILNALNDDGRIDTAEQEAIDKLVDMQNNIQAEVAARQERASYYAQLEKASRVDKDSIEEFMGSVVENRAERIEAVESEYLPRMGTAAEAWAEQFEEENGRAPTLEEWHGTLQYQTFAVPLEETIRGIDEQDSEIARTAFTSLLSDSDMGESWHALLDIVGQHPNGDYEEMDYLAAVGRGTLPTTFYEDLINIERTFSDFKDKLEPYRDLPGFKDLFDLFGSGGAIENMIATYADQRSQYTQMGIDWSMVEQREALPLPIRPYVEGEDAMTALQDQGVDVNVDGDTTEIEADIDGIEGQTLMEYVDGDATGLEMSITDQDGRTLQENVTGDASQLAAVINSYANRTITVKIRGQQMFAEGGRATTASIFGEAGPEWAIPEEHTQRTADLLMAAAAASGFTWPDLMAAAVGAGSGGSSGSGGGTTTTTTQPLVYAPVISAPDATGVESVLREDKDRLAKWWEERQMREAAEVYQ